MHRRILATLAGGVLVAAFALAGGQPAQALPGQATAAQAQPPAPRPAPAVPDPAWNARPATSQSHSARGPVAAGHLPLHPDAGVAHPNVSQYWYGQAGQDPSTPSTTNLMVAQIQIMKPGQISSGEHSVAELGVTDSTGNQAVEIGWDVEPAKYGDNDPHVFASAWVNGVWLGYQTGGWVDYAPNTTYNGGTDINSLVGGTAPSFSIQYDSASNAIWLGFNGQWLGDYPASLWTGATPAASLTTFTKQYAFGEVYGPTVSPCDDMGDGVLPSGTGPAKIGSVGYQSGSTAPNLTTWATNSSYYNAALLTGTVRSFAYGGPGAC